MKRITVGVLAHVDAGKTTLSEALLYTAGAIAHCGRVDKKDTHFDTAGVERERGITVFSSSALFRAGDTEVTLLDTPGHVDFSCETERTLCVEDYAILVISATDGVQSHTKTLWHLLAARGIPAILFVNKTDIAEESPATLMRQIRTLLSPACVDFTEKNSEEIASADVSLMDEFLNTGSVSDASVATAVRGRKLFPCFFGSALKLTGVRDFLAALDRYTLPTPYQDRLLGLKVYKIARDRGGARLTYLKVTGGTLSVKDRITYRDKNGGHVTECVEDLREVTGEKPKALRTATPGMLVSIPGLTKTYPGLGIGIEPTDGITAAPVLHYRLILPENTDPYTAYVRLTVLAEEDPSLGLFYDEQSKELSVNLMGDIQKEILVRIIRDRFGLDVTFGEGWILYRETVKSAVIGSGHFEPLRHYAEVHLRIEPLPTGSGTELDSECPADVLPLHFQRLILSHLGERTLTGPLTGAPLTDVRIVLIAGRAHPKHTEGGDFRQATFRALRQGLRKADCILLEPSFDFTMHLPRESLGRAMNDIAERSGTCEPPEFEGDTATLCGNAPVSALRSYATVLRAYTGGEGRLTLQIGDCLPCKNAQEVIAASGYDPDLDERNTANSVFCKAGAGYVVSWQEADTLMHVRPDKDGSLPEESAPVYRKTSGYRGTAEEDKELLRIFEDTYGKIRPRTVSEQKENAAENEKEEKTGRRRKTLRPTEEYLLVDGYNLLHACPDIQKKAKNDLDTARELLIRILCNYVGYRKCRMTVVFDAYRRKGGEGSTEKCGGLEIVFTKENETADARIERIAHDTASGFTVRVVTSDEQVQRMILGDGALRCSAAEFYKEMETTAREIREIIDS